MGIIYSILTAFGCKQIKSRPEDVNLNMNGKSIYDFIERSIDGREISLADYKGKKLLIVNVASECGYTPQYKNLQSLYEKYNDKLVILGFPANNFGSQEPGTNEEIKKFCSSEYSVTFPMFAKISVLGDDQNDLYKWLTSKDLNGWNDKAPNWNFCKYLVDESGKLMKFYSSAIDPLGDEIVSQLK
jgi:glutathione peroxidase